MKRAIVLFFISHCLSFLAVSVTAHGQWMQCPGPYGGSLNALASDGYGLFAGTYQGGFYVTTNSCANWLQRNNGLSNLTINVFMLA